MNILYSNFNPIPSRQANGVNSMMVCNAFAKCNHNILAVFPKFKHSEKLFSDNSFDIYEYYNISRSVHIKYLGLTKIIKIKWVGPLIFSLMILLYAAIKRVDLVYTRRLELAVLASVFGYKVAYESHNIGKVKGKKQLLYKLFKKLYSKGGDRINVFVTTKNGRDVFLSDGFDPKRVTVESNGVCVRDYRQGQYKTVMNRVTYCGSSFLNTGHMDVLLDLAKNFPQKDFLIIGGSKKDHLYFKDQIKENGISNMQLKQYVPPSFVKEYICSSEILLLLYFLDEKRHLHYASPMKMFEYLASGVPIVATYFPTITDVLTDEENAIVVKSNDSKAIREGLAKLISDKELYKKIGVNAQQDSLYYDWQARISRIISKVNND